MSTLLQKDVDFNFDKECKKAFDELKKSLTSAPIIQAPNCGQPFEIMCDASNYALGNVLGQMKDKKSMVLQNASKILDTA